MSISPLNGQEQLRATRAVTAFRGTAASAGASSPARQADSVSLSDAARSLANARKATSEASDVRADRVAEIKASIANGTYTVDSRQLARAMVKHISL
jgi:negative regulator of flagellin synthesis FlgM